MLELGGSLEACQRQARGAQTSRWAEPAGALPGRGERVRTADQVALPSPALLMDPQCCGRP